VISVWIWESPNTYLVHGHVPPATSADALSQTADAAEPSSDAADAAAHASAANAAPKAADAKKLAGTSWIVISVVVVYIRSIVIVFV
jgi:hypothetical protein